MMSCYYKMNHTHLFLKDFITELTFFHTQSIEGFRGGKKFELWNYGVIIFFFFLILSPQIRHIKYINFKNYTLYHYYKQESLIITELSKTQLFIFIEHDCHYRFIFLSNHIHFFFFLITEKCLIIYTFVMVLHYLLPIGSIEWSCFLNGVAYQSTY